MHPRRAAPARASVPRCDRHKGALMIPARRDPHRRRQDEGGGRQMDVVLRAGYAPLRGFIQTVGAMVLLFRKTILASLTPPYNYGPELVDQFLFALRLGWFPMILASLAFTYGPAGIEVGNFLNLLGALDRLGGLFVIIVMREFAPLVCAIVMAGVAGTAMTADLGARKIREELDALMVLGVDPIKRREVSGFT